MTSQSLRNIFIGAAMALSASALPAVAAECQPDEKMDVQMSLPPEVKLEDGQVVHSITLSHGCDIDFDTMGRTPTGEQKLHVVTVPAGYEDTKDIGYVDICAQSIAAEKGIEGDHTSMSTTYIFEQKAKSDPLHAISVTPYKRETLDLGKEFLEANSKEACTALFSKHADQIFSNNTGGAFVVIP